MKLLIRWGISTIAVLATVYLMPGISVTGNNALFAAIVVAAILGVINVLIKPILSLLSCGLLLVTLGLFMFVINAMMLLLTSWVAQNWFGIGFVVEGFWPALWGSIAISIVSWIFTLLLPDEDKSSK
ncbi:MAG: phage holin family protein [bacterium]